MKNKIKKILLQSGLISVPDDGDETLSHYGLDSLTLVISIVELEKELGIKINPMLATLENFNTINQIIKLVEEQQKES